MLQASEITNKLGQTVKELLWTKLEQKLRYSEKLLIQMMLQSKSYPIRNYTNSLEVAERERVITLFREVLSTHRGVIGEFCSNFVDLACDLYDYLKNREASTVLCSVAKHAGSG